MTTTLKTTTTLNMDRTNQVGLALKADAAASGGLGALLLAGAGILAEPLGAPASLLRSAGIVLVVFAAFVAWVGLRPELWRGAAWAIVVVNALWTLASIAAALADWFPLTTVGKVFVLAQAAAVVVLALWQVIGLRKA
jgi:hypothetical protein